jgi:hypothetical protein
MILYNQSHIGSKLFKAISDNTYVIYSVEIQSVWCNSKDLMSYTNSYCETSLDGLAEELDGPAVSALWRAIAEVMQCWSDIGWVTKNLSSRAPPCFKRHVKSLVMAFAVVSTYQPAPGSRGGLWPL